MATSRERHVISSFYLFLVGQMEVQLAGGPDSCSGRAEFKLNGSWVTIGAAGWGLPEAMVVCRQLGCGLALSAPTGNQYGIGTGPAVLEEVKCSGSESSLAECKATPTGPHKCICGTYAGAICKGKSGNYLA